MSQSPDDNYRDIDWRTCTRQVFGAELKIHQGMPCPHCKGTDRFYMPSWYLFYCRGCMGSGLIESDTYRPLWDLVQVMQFGSVSNQNFNKALEYVDKVTGSRYSRRSRGPEYKPDLGYQALKNRRLYIDMLWQMGQPIEGTPGEDYIKARCHIGSYSREHMRYGYVQDGKEMRHVIMQKMYDFQYQVGINRTFFEMDGDVVVSKDKRMLNYGPSISTKGFIPCMGIDYSTVERLVVMEGTENAIASAAYDFKGCDVQACLNAGNMVSIPTYLQQKNNTSIKRIDYVADNDATFTGLQAAAMAAKRTKIWNPDIETYVWLPTEVGVDICSALDKGERLEYIKI